MIPNTELLRLRARASHPPVGIHNDDALWGVSRDRYFRLMNEERASAGLPPLVNDEEGSPDLAPRRRLFYALAELARRLHVGECDGTLEDELDELDSWDLSDEKRHDFLLDRRRARERGGEHPDGGSAYYLA